jgi:hypothetical protein
VRLRHLLDGRPRLIAFDPDAPRPPEPNQSTEERLATLRQLRSEHLAILERVSSADLDRSSEHPEYGATTLRMVLNTWAAHDLDHTMQAETALMQVFIPHCGHWRWEFTSKDVEAQAAPVS